jgi:hypothetical protein
MSEREELLKLRDELQADADHIKMQLEHARARARQDNDYSDGDWYARAQAALRAKNREIQKITRKAAALRRQEKGSFNMSYERHFVEEAFRRLDPQVFQAIKDTAMELAEQEGGSADH